MRIILLTYGDDTKTKEKALTVASGKKHGVSVAWPQNPDTIDQEFIHFNQEHFDKPGCQLWKPYIIYKAMIQPSVNDGDVIIYADAGTEFTGDVREMVREMTRDFLVTSIDWYCVGVIRVCKESRAWAKGYLLDWQQPEEPINIGTFPFQFLSWVPPYLKLPA